MFQTLMNNSITIIFVITLAILIYGEYKRYIRRKNMSPKEFRSMLRLNYNKAANDLLIKLIASCAITFVISMVSFRSLWMNDAFHIVFLTNLLYAPVVAAFRSLTK